MKKSDKELICKNRKAFHEYDVIETIEAGIVLTGTEIKSIRLHHIYLDGSFAVVEDNQVFLVNCNIETYTKGTSNNHEPKRKRKLLLHKSEIRKFAEHAKIKGFTLIPLQVYIVRGRDKIDLAICKGKQLHDKRQAIKDREAKKETKNV